MHIDIRYTCAYKYFVFDVNVLYQMTIITVLLHAVYDICKYARYLQKKKCTQFTK